MAKAKSKKLKHPVGILEDSIFKVEEKLTEKVEMNVDVLGDVAEICNVLFRGKLRDVDGAPLTGSDIAMMLLQVNAVESQLNSADSSSCANMAAFAAISSIKG